MPVKAAPETVVPGPKTRRHEILDAQLEELAGTVTKHFHRLRIHQDDVTRGIRNDHSIRSGFDDAAERIGVSALGEAGFQFSYLGLQLFGVFHRSKSSLFSPVPAPRQPSDSHNTSPAR